MPRQLTLLGAAALVLASASWASAQPTGTGAPPATEPPATEPPATEPPATEPPATEPPAADASRTSDAPPTPSAAAAPVDEIGDQGISAQLGLAGGGRTTPGGLRIAGHYLYQLSDRDWFDGAASFTFGSGSAACFRDRMDVRICNHGIADGTGIEVVASIRRLFAPQGDFRPFARGGVGLGVARFSDDDVSGFTLALHGGGGVRVKVAPAIAVIADGELVLGFGGFGRGVGTEPQFGLAVTAGAEFRLR